MSRTKDQWLEKTGGFRLGETPGQFQARAAEIRKIREAIGAGQANAKDVNRLAELLGTDETED